MWIVLLGSSKDKRYLRESYCSEITVTDIPQQMMQATAVETYGWRKYSYGKNCRC